MCALMACGVEEDCSVPVRPGNSGKGVPFWNGRATFFRYAPSFAFAKVEGAERYRFTLVRGSNREIHETHEKSPEAPLSSIWNDLAPGPWEVVCEGLDADGTPLGEAGRRAFVKTAPFRGQCAPAARPYRLAALMIYDYMTSLPAMTRLVETGLPDQEYQHNAYPSKTHAAHIAAMLDWAAFDHANREKAMRFAVASGDYLLSQLEPPDAPLAFWPPTYGREPLAFDPAANGGENRPSMVGNDPEGAAKYRGQVMTLYPASAGIAFVRLAAATGERKYLDAAIGIGETYLKTRRADGTWPLKYWLATGEVQCPNPLVPTEPLAFFEALADATGETKWRAAADDCFAWLERGPLTDWNWDGQFEDIEPRPPYQDLTKDNAIDTLFQLLKRKGDDPATRVRARELLRWSEDQFVFWEAPCAPEEILPRPDGGQWRPGRFHYPSVFEQYSCYTAIDASAAKMIAAYLAMFRAEGDPLDLAKARALADAITQIQEPSGRVPTFWSPKDDPVSTPLYDWLNCMAASAKVLADLDAAIPPPPVTSTFGGNLNVPSAKTLVCARSAGTNWQIVGTEMEGDPLAPGLAPGAPAPGPSLFRLSLHPEVNLPPICCTLRVANVPGGVRAEYAFTPTGDVSLNMLAVESQFQFADYAGGHIEADGTRIVLPDGRNPVKIFSGAVTNLVVAAGTPDGPRLSLAFDAPTSVFIQNGRPWNQEHFALRIFPDGESPFLKGREYRVAMTIRGAGAFDPDGGKPLTLADNPDWVPLATSPWIAPGSALDFSTVVPHHSPAGKFGRVMARGGHFEFENLPGVTQRFYGVNICGDANVPPLGTADRFAANLARAGYNAIRIHHHETDLVAGTVDPSATTLNPERMRRFDALVAACIEHGLYLTTDLFVSRQGIAWRSVGEDRDGTVDMVSFKHLVPVHEGVWSNYTAFVRNFLSHRNEFTGRPLAEEPALVGLSLVNEGPLDSKPPSWYAHWPQWREEWSRWITARRNGDPGRWEGVPENLEEIPDIYDSAATAAFLDFLQEVESRFAARVRAVLRDELGCRVPLTNMNCGYRNAFMAVWHDAYDYIDTHFYIDHPVFLGRAWRPPQQCPNANPFKSPTRGGLPVATLRFFDRPFTVSEWNYCGPGKFRGLGGITTGAEAALQDWSGLWRFAWTHGSLGVTHPEEKGVGSFDIANDPLQRAGDLACACLFLRGDLAPLREKFAVGIPRSVFAAPDPLLNKSAADKSFAAEGWTVRLGTELTDGPSAPGFAPGAPEPGSSPVSIDEATGRFTISTPRTAGGFAEGGAINAGAMRAVLSGAPATIWASSLDGEPLSTSRHILVAHLTDVQPRGAIYADWERTILLEWGAPQPLVMRVGRAEVSLALAPCAGKGPDSGTASLTSGGGAARLLPQPQVFTLAPDGTRRCEVPSAFDPVTGRLSFTAIVARDPASATYLYEISRPDAP